MQPSVVIRVGGSPKAGDVLGVDLERIPYPNIWREAAERFLDLFRGRIRSARFIVPQEIADLDARTARVRVALRLAEAISIAGESFGYSAEVDIVGPEPGEEGPAVRIVAERATGKGALCRTPFLGGR